MKLGVKIKCIAVDGYGHKAAYYKKNKATSYGSLILFYANLNFLLLDYFKLAVDVPFICFYFNNIVSR